MMQPLHRQPDGRFGTRQRDDRAFGRSCPAQARLIIAAEPISLVAEHPEQLAEPVEPLLEQRRRPLRRCCRAR